MSVRGLFSFGGRPLRAFTLICIAMGLAAAGLIAWKTFRDLRPLPLSLSLDGSTVRKVRILDRKGIPLSTTYSNNWNLYDFAPLREIPPLLQQAFIESEDKRFYTHRGVDWPARFHALAQNARSFRAVRGASTITEQVTRMLHPRARTLWSRWLEGIEASRLEKRFSKQDILEFYLNQVPYARQRRGVVQAARLYFERDPDTLDVREMLALAVLVRSPSNLDLRGGKRSIESGLDRLAAKMKEHGSLTEAQYDSAVKGNLVLHESRPTVEAGHFVQHVSRSIQGGPGVGPALTTTLEASLQASAQRILDSRLKDLHSAEIRNGAVLVVDHRSDEVLAWVNGGGLTPSQSGGWIDAVTTPRQPGSTLKPFLYALALEMGWNAATLIEDSPLAEAVGSGLHNFHNYSRSYYGPLRLRVALGNSLNIPAVRTIQFTGTERFLERLRLLGIRSLSESSDFYGQGLALGDGEITLFELVQAYATLARQGEFRPLRTVLEPGGPAEGAHRVFSRETASIITDVLSDPEARRLEFGDGNILRFPVQTAVKTGTSSDHRDSWIVGFSHRYTVGVWMGNLDRHPTNGITGLAGPALVLRAVFAELNRYEEPQALEMSPDLVTVSICAESGLRAGPHCPAVQEWFERDRLSAGYCGLHEDKRREDLSKTYVQAGKSSGLRLLQPTPGLRLAMDPRIPDALEAFALTVPKRLRTKRIEWIIDGEVAGVTGSNVYRFLWPLSKGSHLARARIRQEDAEEAEETPEVRFYVE